MKIGPAWTASLAMAREWSKAPWELFSGPKMLWVFRWQAVQEATAEVAEKLREFNG